MCVDVDGAGPGCDDSRSLCECASRRCEAGFAVPPDSKYRLGPVNQQSVSRWVGQCQSKNYWTLLTVRAFPEDAARLLFLRSVVVDERPRSSGRLGLVVVTVVAVSVTAIGMARRVYHLHRRSCRWGKTYRLSPTVDLRPDVFWRSSGE